jgi:peptide deformylase
MTSRDIITLPNPVLRQKSRAIKKFGPEIDRLADDMIAATLDWEDNRPNEVSVAMAAVQVAKPIQLVVIRNDFKDKADKSFTVLANPKIVSKRGKPEIDHEGCLSVKDVYGMVPRYPHIKVRAFELDGKPIEFEAHGFLARLIQHEIDHNNGVLFIDHIKDDDFLRLDESGELIPLSKNEYKKYHLFRQ